MDGERYLVVSAGSIGRRHIANLRHLRPDAEIGVLRLHNRATQESLPEYADLQFDCLASAISFRPGAAIIASPATTHLELANAFADAGIHLFIEKPISHSTEGVQALIEKAQAHEIKLMVGYNLRFLPSLRKVRELINSGTIGEVRYVRADCGQYLPDWQPETDYRTTVSARSELGGACSSS